MRWLFILSFVLLAACAKSEQAKNNAPVTCELQASPEQATYPDGQTLKSDVWKCSDGCIKYAWVNDNSVTFNSCERL